MSISEWNASIANNIRETIAAKGVKHRYIAERAGISEQSLSNMLTNKKIIKVSDIRSLADILDVTPNDLFGIPPDKSQV